MTEPGVTSAAVMRSPSSHVPLVLWRSRTRQDSPFLSISAWYSDTVAESEPPTTTSLSGARPIRVRPPATGKRVPVSAPERDRSQGLARVLMVGRCDIILILGAALRARWHTGTLFEGIELRGRLGTCPW